MGVRDDVKRKNAILEILARRDFPDNREKIVPLFIEVAESSWGFEIAKDFAMGDYPVNKLLALKMSVEWVGDDVERKNIIFEILGRRKHPDMIMPLFLEVAESSWGFEIAKFFIMRDYAKDILKVLKMSAEWVGDNEERKDAVLKIIREANLNRMGIEVEILMCFEV